VSLAQKTPQKTREIKEINYGALAGRSSETREFLKSIFREGFEKASREKYGEYWRDFHTVYTLLEDVVIKDREDFIKILGVVANYIKSIIKENERWYTPEFYVVEIEKEGNMFWADVVVLFYDKLLGEYVDKYAVISIVAHKPFFDKERQRENHYDVGISHIIFNSNYRSATSKIKDIIEGVEEGTYIKIA